MKSLVLFAGISLGFMLHFPATTFAAGSYSESLQAADAALGAAQPEVALQEIATALTQAANDGERALAVAKKAYVLAFSRQDYSGARQAANQALEVEGLAPVAKVSALQALAQCQIEADRDIAGAITSLETAMQLPDVDWAKPDIGFTLAESYRESMQLNKAFDTYQRVTEMANAHADMKANSYLHMGFIFQYDRKDAAGARQAYAKAVELRPTLQAEVDRHLGSLGQ
jgi:tetratricopeptide (TPR) repeat protein